MAWQPRRLTAEQLESGRYTQAEVARHLAVSPGAMCEWARCLKEEGLSVLETRTRAGGPSKLTDEQWQEVKRLTAEGAKATGSATER